MLKNQFLAILGEVFIDVWKGAWQDFYILADGRHASGINRLTYVFFIFEIVGIVDFQAKFNNDLFLWEGDLIDEDVGEE